MVNEMSLFFAHTHAMSVSIMQQHTRRRAVFMHVLRAFSPLLFMVLIWKAQHMISNADIGQAMGEVMGGQDDIPEMQMAADDVPKMKVTIPPAVKEQIVDYLYGATILAVAVAALHFFVSRLASELESGMRHLMHTSGLSRPAFWTSMAGLEGFAQVFAEAAIVTFVGGPLLGIRAAVHTSPVLLLISLCLVCSSVVVFSCFLCLLLQSQRFSGIAATLSALALLFVTPITYMSSGGRFLLATVPIIPSVHSLWALAQACAMVSGGDPGALAGADNGKCLSLHDIYNTTRVPIQQVVFSDDRYSGLKSREIFVVAASLACLQICMYTVSIWALDMYRHPTVSWRSKIANAVPKSSDEECAKQSLALRVRNAVHWYGMFGQAKGGNDSSIPYILKGISFDIPSGSMLGLLGPNGAGKTTMIRCITGEEIAKEGDIVICPSDDGVSSKATPYNESDVLRRRKGSMPASSTCCATSSTSDAYLGLCPQETILNPELTILEHLTLYARLRCSSDPYREANTCLRALCLENKRDFTPYTLSGGQRRRLAIGCGLVANPVLTLLDEPTVGLDPVCRREIWDAIQAARDAGGACLLTTHMLDEVEYLCSNVVIMTGGRVAAEGSVQNLRDAWSKGYFLNVDTESGKEQAVRKYLASMLPAGCGEPIKASSQGQLVYNVSKDTTFIGNLFIHLTNSAEQNGIIHWGISQSSFEDVYLQVISHQDRDRLMAPMTGQA